MRPATAALPLAAVLVVGAAGTAVADRPDFAVTVGVPNRSLDGRAQAGVIDNRLGGGAGAQVLSEAELGRAGPPDLVQARFGAAMLVADLDGDGFDDLIAGAPGHPGAAAHDVPGRVDILFGSATGITAARAVTVPTKAETGDEFGAALSLSVRRIPSGGVAGVYDLWIGAPGHDVAGRADAGAVFRYSLDTAGTATYLETVTQDSALVPGAAEAQDRFGAVLARHAENGTLVGVPSEDLGTRKDAGALQLLRTDPQTNALIKAPSWTQDSPGLAGKAEAGDRFGAALSWDGSAVGVPGEDVGQAKDAGLVQTFGRPAEDPAGLVPSAAFTQNSKGVPGVAETGDRFGTALSDGLFTCYENPSVAIGAPGEDLGSIKDAGSVTLIHEPYYATGDRVKCPAQVISQGNGLPGVPEAGDHLGAAMGVWFGDEEAADDQIDTLVIGIPGEDIGTRPAGRDVGRVVLRTGITASTVGFRDGDVPGLRFGSLFAS